jgi:hypothetical protein
MNNSRTKAVTNTTPLFLTIKQWCLEQFWIFALLTPLVVFAVLGVKHLQAKNNSHNSSTETLDEVVTASAEITSAEVALIVVKPIGEILAMQVYLDEKTSHSGQSLAALEVEAVLSNSASKQILTYGHRRVTPQVSAYSEHNKNNKNQKMAEQS